MINPKPHPLVPGTAPVAGASLANADANITAFKEAVAAIVAADEIVVEDPERDPDHDDPDAGRYGYILSSADGASVHILMPGAPLDLVRDRFGDDAPCLIVNGNYWWWPSAVTIAAGALRG